MNFIGTFFNLNSDENIITTKLNHLFPNEYLILKSQQKSALAAALEMRRFYQQIYLAQPIIPLSNKDLGYLPGNLAAKLDPYMQ